MENIINTENNNDYNSILQKIDHKPLIVEYIFSFIKNKPYKFLNLIEKDKILKNKINSQFSLANKDNSFSQETNNNIKLLIIYKKYKEILNQFKDKDASILSNHAFENSLTKDELDPSFILYKSKYILNQINKDKALNDLSLEGLSEITFNEQEKNEHIELVLLPSKKKKFKDGLYIEKNLNNENDLKDNKCLNKEIDILYCIIDDNEYYLDDIPHINKNIIINELYFIYIKGIKDINIYDSIEKYLNILNINIKNIKQITFGISFYNLGNDKKINGYSEGYLYYDNTPIMRMINDALVKNKKIKLPEHISINLAMKKCVEPIKNVIKFNFGIYFLFEKKFDGLIEVNSKSYNSNIIDKIKDLKPKFLIIKYKGISSLDDENFNKFVKKCLKIYIPYVIFYIAKGENYNKKKTEKVTEFNLDEDTGYLLYNEIPNKYLQLEHNLKTYERFEVTDSDDNIILQERKINPLNKNELVSHLFLLKEYKNLCFKWNYNEKTYYKIYFIKKDFVYDVFIVNKFLVEKYYNAENNIEKYMDKRIYVRFNEVINYCKGKLNLKIDKIINNGFPYEWSDVLKNKKKNKGENKNKNKTSGENLTVKKINPKKILDYELEEDDYYDDEDEDEENNDFPDEN